MTIQARMSAGDPRLYCVERDLAHNFGAVAAETIQRLELGRWPAVTELQAKFQVSDEQLGQAIEGFCSAVAAARDSADEPMHECFSRCGFLDAPPQAQVAVMATLGLCMTGAYFQGVREAAFGRVTSLEGLAAAGRELHERLTLKAMEVPGLSESDLRWAMGSGSRSARLLTPEELEQQAAKPSPPAVTSCWQQFMRALQDLRAWWSK